MKSLKNPSFLRGKISRKISLKGGSRSDYNQTSELLSKAQKQLEDLVNMYYYPNQYYDPNLGYGYDPNQGYGYDPNQDLEQEEEDKKSGGLARFFNKTKKLVRAAIAGIKKNKNQPNLNSKRGTIKKKKNKEIAEKYSGINWPDRDTKGLY